MVLVRYSKTDGAITGVWSAATPDLLAPNIVVEDPTHGYLMTEAITEPKYAGMQYRVDPETETLHAKAALQITATPGTFPADGVTECVITVAPFVPCTVLVNRTPVVLTPDDPALGLTAYVPARFLLELDPLATHWALPVTVEAV